MATKQPAKGEEAMKRDGQQSSPTLSKDLYFEDGNILLDVVDSKSNRRTRYCVHKSFLARHSKYFANMFKSLRPPEQKFIAGLPVIELTGTEIDDWDIVLGALYSPFFNVKRKPARMLVAMLRIGKKYQFQEFLEDARDRLRQCYPESLERFRKKTATIGPSSVSKLLEVVQEGILPDKVLPVLYFENLKYIDKFDDPETIKSMNVSESTKLQLMVGHRRLLNAQAQHTYAFLWNEIPENCQGPARKCKASFLTLKQTLDTPAHSGSIPIRPFERFGTILPLGSTFCKVCKPYLNKSMEEGAEKVWDMLPGCFGLGTWGDLAEPEDQPVQSEG